MLGPDTDPGECLQIKDERQLQKEARLSPLYPLQQKGLTPHHLFMQLSQESPPFSRQEQFPLPEMSSGLSLLLHPGDLSWSLLSLANVHVIHESPGSVSGPSSGLPQALLLLDLLLCVSTSRGPRILYKQGWGCSPLMPQHLAQRLIQSSYSTPFSWLVEWLQVSCSKFSFDFCSSMPLPLGSC